MAKEVLTRERILCHYKDKMRSSLKPVIGFLICLTCILAQLILTTIHIYGVGFAFYCVVLFDAMVAFLFAFV